MRAGYSGVIEAAPNTQTRTFAGLPINISAIARTVGCTPSHLARVFSGTNTPSLPLSRAIAHSLGITMDEFVAQLDLINKDAAAAA